MLMTPTEAFVLGAITQAFVARSNEHEPLVAHPIGVEHSAVVDGRLVLRLRIGMTIVRVLIAEEEEAR